MFARSGRKDTPSPLVMPVLSSGKHRSPRSGACFMEFASYLAGEQWSDHPGCTHPALAQLARSVNDRISDTARQGIVPMIPDVIGLDGDDPVFSLVLAREAALTALAVCADERVRVSVLAVIRCEDLLAHSEGRGPWELSERTESAFALHPNALAWAMKVAKRSVFGRDLVLGAAPAAIIDYSVVGIATAQVPDADAMLVSLLERGVAIGRQRLQAVPTTSRQGVSAQR